MCECITCGSLVTNIPAVRIIIYALGVFLVEPNYNDEREPKKNRANDSLYVRVDATLTAPRKNNWFFFNFPIWLATVSRQLKNWTEGSVDALCVCFVCVLGVGSTAFNVFWFNLQNALLIFYCSIVYSIVPNFFAAIFE